MTDIEKQEIISAVLSSLRTNSRTIEQLTPVSSLLDSDSFEVSGGKRITYADLTGLIGGDALSSDIAALQSALSAEATTRQQADGQLHSDIDTEAHERTDADAALSGRIDSLSQTVNDDITAAIADLEAKLVVAVEIDEATGEVSLVYDSESSLYDARVDEATGDLILEYEI